jgi:hypothetical protein
MDRMSKLQIYPQGMQMSFRVIQYYLRISEPPDLTNQQVHKTASWHWHGNRASITVRRSQARVSCECATYLGFINARMIDVFCRLLVHHWYFSSTPCTTPVGSLPVNIGMRKVSPRSPHGRFGVYMRVRHM